MHNPIHFYFGDEPFLIQEAAEQEIKKYSDYQIEKLENQFDINQLITFTQNTGLFASKTLIIIKNPFFLTKKCSPKEEKDLENCLKNCNGDTTKIVIYNTTKLDQRKKFVTFLKKNATSQSLTAFKDWEQNKILQWIQKRIEQKGKTISQEALFALEQLASGSLQQCASEIETLLILINNKNNIELADINALTGSAKATTYQLTEALKKKNYNNVYAITKTLLNNQEDPIKLLGLFTSSFRLYFQIIALKQAGNNIDTIAKQLKKNAYFLKLIAQELKYSLSELSQNLRILADTDLAIKKGTVKPLTALECAISQMKLQT
ncbi:DNA polymerase III subunit delta [Candidatus Marinamargulisbacteria bacterium SCGC AG-414-C22]|nr:DNA polymerase III subunit delta [Candidatus Marinamargulisbacteria bacterium SCGC AG-414-C22]